MKYIIGLSLMFIFTGCHSESQKTGDIQKTAAVAKPETNGTATTSPSLPEKPIEIKAIDLAGAYQENASAADEKYKEKTLQVSGKVTKRTENFGKLSIETFIQIEGKDSINVLCKLADDQGNAADQLKMGQQATLIGANEGLADDGLSVKLNGCKIN